MLNFYFLPPPNRILWRWGGVIGEEVGSAAMQVYIESMVLCCISALGKYHTGKKEAAGTPVRGAGACRSGMDSEASSGTER